MRKQHWFSNGICSGNDFGYKEVFSIEAVWTRQ